MIPPAASWLPILSSHVGSQVKRRQSQSDKFKEFAKISIILILKQTLHETHILKLLDKMCKYKMDLTNIVEDTERTRFCPHTDKVTPVYPLSTSLKWVGGGITMDCTYIQDSWYKSNVKRWNTLCCLDQYITPNSKYTTKTVTWWWEVCGASFLLHSWDSDFCGSLHKAAQLLPLFWPDIDKAEKGHIVLLFKIVNFPPNKWVSFTEACLH